MVKKKKFDPEGSGYDYDTAERHGIMPQMQSDGKLHWPSRSPKTGQMLKGKSHPTHHKAMEGEEKAGYKVYKGGSGKYYSYKKKRD